jgi:GH15 family glucan-1,4-alpha-glucosidase
MHVPRALCAGNGNLQVNNDSDMNIKDVSFPFVGLENHVGGHFCRFGVWVDRRFSWIDDSWKKRFNYKKDSLVTDFSLKSLGMVATFMTSVNLFDWLIIHH